MNETEKMNFDIGRRWVAALRSGEYAQGIGVLCDDTGYCCLGVLADLYVKDHPNEEGWKENKTSRGSKSLHGATCFPSPKVFEWAGLPRDNPQVLTKDGTYRALSWLNDQAGLTFLEIADIVEAQML